MRISDWISDVCSSDLHGHRRLVNHDAVAFHMLGNGLSYGKHLLQVGGAVFIGRRTYRNELHFAVLHTQNRVRWEERCVGKEVVSTCSSRGSPRQKKKKKN